jgi:hypothetical protein
MKNMKVHQPLFSTDDDDNNNNNNDNETVVASETRLET